tara:strand:- start:100 stop:1044 length:945 start_codon:yes stop_codon:yes gene_type:complete
MISELKPLKFITVLGTTYSGASAVFDYLDGRKDLRNPLKGEEYLLPILPNGLMTLEAATEKAFDPAICEYHLIMFQEISRRLVKYWSRQGKNKKFILLFHKCINQFINDISCVDYPMRLFWRELANTSLEKKLHRAQNLLGFKKFNHQARLLVSEKKFIKAAHKMHTNLFKKNGDNKPIILNQGGSGWNPIESTKYFKNPKILIITRDPRDQYLEIKHSKKGYSVMGFIGWYKEMQRRLKLIKDKNVLIIKFENFVNYNKRYKKIICKHLKISNKIISSYKAELSQKNIGKFRKNLDRKDIKLIEKHLRDFIYV